MLIVAVGGLALITIADILPGHPPTLAERLIVVVSAVAATWLDLDEPGSWLSRRVRLALSGVGVS